MSTTATPFTPTPFILKERFTRIDCPLDGYAGLWFEVRMNLSNGELHALREAVQALDDQTSELGADYMERAQEIDARRAAVPAEDGATRWALFREAVQNKRAYEAALEPIGIERRSLIAPYIRAWNFYEPDPAGGEPIPLPPPCQAPEVLGELSGDVILWLCREVLTAYQGGAGFATGSGRSAAAPEPGQTPSSGGPQIREPLSPSPRRRSKSSGRKAST
jgi:hypothetical protein